MQDHVRHDAAVDHVYEAVSRVDDAVVMRYHHDGRTILNGSLLEQTDDIHRCIPIERCGRLVGEDQSRAIDERAADRDPLPLAAREKPRLVTDPVAEPEALENAGAAPPKFGRRSISELCRHLDVLVSGKRLE